MFKRLIFFILIFSCYLYADTLKVGIYQNAPKIFIDDNKQPSGFFPELLNEIAKEQNWNLEYIECKWEDCLLMIENNQLDIMPDVAYSKTREERFDFSKEIVLSNWSEIYINKKSKINSVLDLTNKKVAILKNSIQYEFIKDTIELFDVHPIFVLVNDFEESLILLEKGEVEATIVNNFYGKFYAQKYNIVKTDILLSPSALKIAYSKQIPSFVKDSIDEKLKIYKNDTSSIYFTLKNKWLVTQEQRLLPEWMIYAFIIGIVIILILSSLVAFFRYMVGIKANEIEKQTLENHRLAQEQAKDYKNVLLALVKVIEQRDSYTAGHSQRVADYSKILAKDLGIDESNCDILYEAGILHDIGKVAIPDVILLKPESLTDKEYQLIKEHVNVGIDILERVPRFKKLANIIKYHHEKYDGSGYPYGLKGDEIPMLSHIMILADAFDAMTTSRIYRHKRSLDFALQELEKLKYIQFHPKVVQSALKVFKNIKLEDFDQHIPATKLEEERMIYFYKDSVTQLFNNKYFKSILAENEETHYYKYIYIFSLHNFAQYNYTQGWEAGDVLLMSVAKTIKESFDNKILCRLHADNFVILSHQEIHFSKEFLDRLKHQLISDITYSLQCFDLRQENVESINAILKNFKFKTNLIYDSSNDNQFTK
jgi:putative nucleotidyltransferase with HDIG domain